MSGLFLCAALLATAWSTASAAPLLLAVRRATALAEFTTANVGARLALRIERRTLVKAVIREPIRGGLLQDSGGLTADEALGLARRLTAGRAKAEAEVAKD